MGKTPPRLTLLQLELLLEVLASTRLVVVRKTNDAEAVVLRARGLVRTEETYPDSGRIRIFALPAGRDHVANFRARRRV